ncbi:F0F1 ATP synthase subunit delta [Desertivibrio insolitus]|uniref:F0F1 ATP synthase subunit delta n=1 Tax=Herbiconiux sp. SYSU D00978 TaxID=2812562 RepID=UPI001A9577A0|nr:F0F1 ATP synthase subunit delta [Herbiconiux sp. SYSU D00978]
MGSASREALAASRAALESGAVTPATGADILAAVRVIDGSAQLRNVLADPAIGGADKGGIVDRIFASIDAEARRVLTVAVSQRWSSQNELVEGLEELGFRAVASAAPEGESIESQLFTFQRAVASDARLELALGSRLGDAQSKVRLVDSLLAGKAGAGTLAIVQHLVQHPGSRRTSEAVRHAAAIVADHSGMQVATVTSAAPLANEQVERLRAGLAAKYGRPVRINLLIDPSLIGGVRVQIGDDVIDGSVASKLNDLRLQLAS